MDDIEKKESIELMHDRYEYWDRVPKRGLLIGGRPAITQIDPSLIGDYMIMTVRDPLAAYGKDPAEYVADHLEDVVLAGKSGMFTVYTGTYKGARISVCSGGSGCQGLSFPGKNRRITASFTVSTRANQRRPITKIASSTSRKAPAAPRNVSMGVPLTLWRTGS